jgi:hypothetical protein
MYWDTELLFLLFLLGAWDDFGRFLANVCGFVGKWLAKDLRFSKNIGGFR